MMLPSGSRSAASSGLPATQEQPQRILATMGDGRRREIRVRAQLGPGAAASRPGPSKSGSLSGSETDGCNTPGLMRKRTLTRRIALLLAVVALLAIAYFAMIGGFAPGYMPAPPMPS